MKRVSFVILGTMFALLAACRMHVIHGPHGGKLVVIEPGHIHSAHCGHHHQDGKWHFVSGHRHRPGCGHVHQNGRWVIKKTGQAIRKAAKKTGQAVKRVAKKTGQAAKNAAKKTGQAMKRTAKAMGKAVKVARGHRCKRACAHYRKGGRWFVITGHRHGARCGHRWRGGAWIVVK